jgi:hypothetical protein
MYNKEKVLYDFEYLKQNYKPYEVQELLNSRKSKSEVYQELKVSKYVLNNYIKHYKLSNVKKNVEKRIDKSSMGDKKPPWASVDNSVFEETQNPVERLKKILARKKQARTLQELRDPYY